MLETALVARWPILGDPTFVSVRHVKRLVGAPGFGDGLACDLDGTSRETSMTGSWMGIRFPGPETIPCLVLFPDQTQPTVEGVRERFPERQPINADFIDI